MPEVTYNSWPIGRLPKEFQRKELDTLRELGYNWNDPLDVVKMFEQKVADFAGAKYGVAVDCCSHGLFLALQCIKKRHGVSTITIPNRTYVSVPMQIKHAGFDVAFEDLPWVGAYQLKPFDIWDAAVRWNRGMYLGGMHIISFQIKKRVPIGRGGMILLDDPEDYAFLKKIRYDGRDLDIGYMEDDFEYLGWHYYMTPEDAARGIILMDQIPELNDDTGGSNNYSDLSTKGIFNND